MRIQKHKAIVGTFSSISYRYVFVQRAESMLIYVTQDERRVVYVGRIRRTMTHDELRERFSQFGEVECVSLHFRDGRSVLKVTLPHFFHLLNRINMKPWLVPTATTTAL